MYDEDYWYVPGVTSHYWRAAAIPGSQWRSTAAASVCKHMLVSAVGVHRTPMDSGDLSLSQHDITDLYLDSRHGYKLIDDTLLTLG